MALWVIHDARRYVDLGLRDQVDTDVTLRIWTRRRSRGNQMGLLEVEGFVGGAGFDRVLVAGASGAGKSSLCRRLHERCGLPYVELDSLFHGPNWSELPTFEAEVDGFIANERWVLEWQYDRVRERLLDRCNLLIWLDYPLYIVMWRVVMRTIRRRLARELLWNANVEPPLWTVIINPEHIVRWSWQSHAGYPARIRAILERRPELPIVRLQHPHDLERLFAARQG
jgi:adenylate kinase family enzyme